MSNSFMSGVGRRIARLRGEQGWSQAELARRIGASREIVGKYERGEAVASLELAHRIADAFGVTLDQLTGGGPAAAPDPAMQRRLHELEALDEADRAPVLFVLDALLREARVRQVYRSHGP